jgi:hypothetical protein
MLAGFLAALQGFTWALPSRQGIVFFSPALPRNQGQNSYFPKMLNRAKRLLGFKNLAEYDLRTHPF